MYRRVARALHSSTGILSLDSVAEGQFLKKQGETLVGADAAGGAEWGSVTGTLSEQTDLQTALDTKGTSNFSGSYNDLSNKPTLGDSSSKNVGTAAGTVSAGDHTHAGGSEAFPVGSVFIAVVSTNPGTLLGYGTWSAFAAGRVLVGIDAGQTEFDTVEETGGAKTHTLTSSEMPAHTHVITSQTATTGGATSYEHGTLDTSSAEAEATEVTGSTGGGAAHNNLQPYIVVYMWKRTA